MPLHLIAVKKGEYNPNGAVFHTLNADVPYFNLQWNRKYYESGDFSVQLKASDYDRSWDAFVVKSEANEEKFGAQYGHFEVGMILKTSFTESANGTYVELSGFMLDKLVDGCITSGFFASETTTSLHNVVNICYGKQGEFVRPQGDLLWYENPAYGRGSHGDLEEHPCYALNYENPSFFCVSIGKHFRQLAMNRECGIIAYQTGQLDSDNVRPYPYVFRFFQGTDKSLGNAYGNTPVILSVKAGTASSAELARDLSSLYKGVVGTYGEDTSRKYVYSKAPTSQWNSEKWNMGFVVNQYNVDEGWSGKEADIIEAKAASDAIGLAVTETFDLEAAGFGAEYVDEFNLGDVVTLHMAATDTFATARVIELNEVSKSGDYSLSVKLGSIRLSNIQKALRFVR